MTQKTSRRRFIQFGAAGVGMLVTNFPGSREAKAASATRSRYLINIQNLGGQDSTWTHSPMLLSDTAGLSTAQLNAEFYGVLPNKLRYPDSLAKPFGNGYLGVSMHAYSAELAKMCVIRGMVPEGSHDVGNRMIQDGHLSGYAASFSTIVADALAKAPDKLRDLHYVQITNSSADFRSQVGFFRGAGLPLNIADAATWDKLSATDAKNPATTAALRNSLNLAVEGLANSTGNALQIKSSQNLFKNDFNLAYDSANSIMGMNFATSTEYVAAVKRYKDAILDDLRALIFGSDTKDVIRAALKFHPNFATFSETGLEAALKANFNVQSLEAMVFPWALADFLVTSDLSAVVDVPAVGGDFHDLNDRDFLASACNMACLRALINRLSSKNVPEGGAKFIDRTLIVYSTEFDRQVARSVLSTANAKRPGTDHGYTSSCIMAGYRIRGNKIVGARGTGPDGQFGALYSPTSPNFLAPLPIDENGNPNAAGELITQRSILPTVCEIFGVSVPAQQKTEMESISAIIKPAV